MKCSFVFNISRSQAASTRLSMFSEALMWLFKGYREQSQYLVTGNISKHIFDFGGTRDQANFFTSSADCLCWKNSRVFCLATLLTCTTPQELNLYMGKMRPGQKLCLAESAGLSAAGRHCN